MKLSHHKRAQRGYVTFQYRTIYIPGHWPAEMVDPPREVRLGYEALLGKLRAGGALPGGKRGRGPREPVGTDYSVGELVADFLEWAEGEYLRRDFYGFRAAGRLLNSQYGLTRAADFGPVRLRSLQLYLIETPYSRKRRVKVPDPTRPAGFRWETKTEEFQHTRTGVNKTVNLVRRIFRWGVSRELVPAVILTGLETVEPVLKGRVRLPETRALGAVSDEILERTAAILPAVLAAMVRLQRLTGMRPAELCRITTGEIDRSDKDCWFYIPKEHKTAGRGKVHVIALGPKSQEVLRPFLRFEPDRPVFSPSERVRELNQAKRAARKTRVQPSQVSRAKLLPDRVPGESYDSRSYARAIRRACIAAAIPVWTPYQLRKAAAMEAAETLDLGAAQARLGHDSSEVTRRHYLERLKTAAKRAAMAVG